MIFMGSLPFDYGLPLGKGRQFYLSWQPVRRSGGEGLARQERWNQGHLCP
ncbi:hypothetical protein [Paenibacillus borealis]|nr:hypothetical protein [Paenibacillus borealis]